MAIEKRTITNGEIESSLPLLDELRKRNDKIGYAAAWNYRRLSETIEDYMKDKATILEDSGVRNQDGTFSLMVGSAALGELLNLVNMERTVEVYTVQSDDAFGNVSGEAIITLDFMFNDAWSIGLE